MNPQIKKSKGHKCYFCGYRFETVNVLRKHVNIHKDKDLECDLCGKLFSSNCGLKKHVKTHTNERPYKCIYCEKGFRQKHNLKSHVEKVHENCNEYTFCQTCGKRLRSGATELQCWLCCYEGKQITSTVVSVSERENTFQAVSDSMTRDDLSNMQNQTEVFDSNDHGSEGCVEQLPSDSCMDSSSKHISLITVKKSALQCKNFMKINFDGKNMNQSKLVIQKNLATDIRYNTIVETDNTKQTTCMQCAETLPSLIALRQHTLEVHKPNWNFSCDLCNEKFATPEAQRNHLVKHEENRPFMCMVCTRSFKSQITLKSHLQTHRPDRPFSCEHCNLSFKTLITLRAHAIVHQQERPFVCRECGFAFKVVDRLKRHMIVHTGEMPYKCDHCGKLFRYPGNLGRHYYLHSQKRLFVCNVCGKEFSQATGLKQHLTKKAYLRLCV